MRPLYPIARTAEEALCRPLAFAKSEVEASALDRAGAQVKFEVELANRRFKNKKEAEDHFETPLRERWGELVVDLNNHWRCWISYFQPITEPEPASSLTKAEKLEIDQRLGAPPKPRRAKAQKGLDFGLFESRDPDRPGWSLIDDE